MVVGEYAGDKLFLATETSIHKLRAFANLCIVTDYKFLNGGFM